MNGTPLLLAIIGHLVGDYLIQNDWMAMKKKQSSLPCAVHCFLWTVSVMAFAGWHGNHDGWRWVIVAVFLFTAHFLQDRTQIIMFWMTQINRQPQFAKPPMAPWSIIVVDNVWHIVTLWAVWRVIESNS